MSGAVAMVSAPLPGPALVVVPVYLGLEDTQACLTSVIAAGLPPHRSPADAPGSSDGPGASSFQSSPRATRMASCMSGRAVTSGTTWM